MDSGNHACGILFFSCSSFLVLCATLHAGVQDAPIRPQVHHYPDSLLSQVVEAINRNQFADAERMIDAQLRSDSDSLRWLFLRGMRYYADIFGAGHGFNKTAMAALTLNLSHVAEIADSRLETNPSDSAGLFWGGGAYGYLGLSYASEGSLFKAVSTAKKGARYHERLISLHPDCYDAYLGPGLMNLLTSAAPWILKPILFLVGLTGTEEKAYEYLSLAYEKGTMVRLEAGVYLAQLYARRKELSKSSELRLTLTRAYPMRVGLRAETLSGLFDERRYNEIIVLSDELISAFETKRYSFTSGDTAWISSIFRDRARASELTGDTQAAIRTWNQFLTGKPYENQSKWRAHDELIDLYLSAKDTSHAFQSYEKLNASDAPPKVKERARERIAAFQQGR